MIETTLVYIHTSDNNNSFIGCGAAVVGSLIVTCRHVWNNAGGDKNGKVNIVFPRSRDNDEELITIIATLVHNCDGNKPVPDLVILSLTEPIPENIDYVGIATSDQFEIGLGTIHAFIPSRDRDANIKGDISQTGHF